MSRELIESIAEGLGELVRTECYAWRVDAYNLFRTVKIITGAVDKESSCAKWKSGHVL